MITRRKTGAFLSGLVYEDWPKVREGLARIGFELLAEPFDAGGSQAMLVMNKRPGEKPEAWIVFRGTEFTDGFVWSDFWSNIGFPTNWEGPGKIHSGYLRHLQFICQPIRAFAELVPSYIPLNVTGHSLGGSEATGYAAWINSGLPTDHKLAALLTYGAPKVLNREGCGAIKCKIERVMNRWDFAQWHPLIPGLTHPKGKVSINSGGWPIPWRRHSVTQYIWTIR